MSSISLPGTSKTPTVQFNLEPLTMSISGRSIPENSIEFYQPLLDWVQANLQTDGTSLEISIRLEYFNTSSSKCIMDLLKRVEKSPCDATVLWYYEDEDEDMLEAGEDYDAIIEIPFKLIATPG
ncbi:MAG TPA: nuclear pore complex subunit [Flavobacteriales bacterium]|jgi:hypothetical protein|nr:DUF1987 domain-containing protein [bacterium]MDC1486364.1 DUF1987 domain-containing protein [Flavobacteriales bacterium]MDO7741029.1 DUF1987 domain-containing protein [Flavobacteriales bacterium]HAW72493.1 nuclear pore complex subunit [Flavobacteriales bacterium]|tara:strand:- start:1353 stop:1724 length:372 start_codon:yes stop_codon:yes gene_type:complete